MSYMELTFFSVYIQTALQEPAEHCLNMFYVALFIRGVDENVVYIGDDISAEHVPEHVIDKTLKNIGCAR